MDITITINCDNAAFADGLREEICHILNEQADKFRLYPLDGLSKPFNIKDINGNTVGYVTISDVD